MTTPKNAARVAAKAAACPNAAAQVTPSDEIGMAWYNNLSEAERARWHAAAGSAVPADAYRAFYEQTAIQTTPSVPTVPDLPTMQQAMRLACAMVSSTLRCAISSAENSGEWRDEFQGPINAAELVLEAVHKLESELPIDLDSFDVQWWRATSVVRMARDAFPRKELGAGRLLNAAVMEFDALHGVVDFLAINAEQEGGAV